MGKRLVVCVMIVLLFIAVALASAGCTNKNKEAAKKAISKAQQVIASAETEGLGQALGPAQSKLTEAQTKLKKDPLRSRALAEEAVTLANKAKEDNLASAKSQVDKAITDAEAIVVSAIPGSDLAQAQQSLAKAKSLKDSAKTIAELVGQTDSAAFYANTAKQQAETASATRQAQIAAEQQAERNRQIEACKAVMLSYARANSSSDLVKIWVDEFQINDSLTQANGIIWGELANGDRPTGAKVQAHREGDNWIIDYFGSQE